MTGEIYPGQACIPIGAKVNQQVDIVYHNGMFSLSWDIPYSASVM